MYEIISLYEENPHKMKSANVSQVNIRVDV
jgi:hypothetical protein